MRLNGCLFTSNSFQSDPDNALGMYNACQSVMLGQRAGHRMLFPQARVDELGPISDQGYCILPRVPPQV